MKFTSLLLIIAFFLPKALFAQGTIPQSFFDGKSVVLVSADPGARPAMSWKQLADSVHTSLVEAGADPVAYFELEQVTLSEEIQADYAKAFQTRLIKNIILVTRQKSQTSIHAGEFSGDGTIITSTNLYGAVGNDYGQAGANFAAIGQGQKSKNLLVLDVPEFLSISSQEAVFTQRFIPRNPLNLDVFKLGIPIEGASAQTGLLSYFKYDNYGKSQETILAEQAAQKSGIEEILKQEYPYPVEWLTEAKTNEELVRDRVQFLLVKVEGREADLMESMGLEVVPSETNSRTVVKYYIKLLVRDELYIGPEWDADPDWRQALKNFLVNLKK
ncbi:NTPase [Algoriphagus marinus]|uniref:NTPase n=1 Tax=Algoriphagus marinus TaxID=1925762 RepID=UPI00094B876A|nr:NTPase [Algoriphagus marinus]